MNSAFTVKRESVGSPLFRVYQNMNRLVFLYLGKGAQTIEAIESGLRAQLGGLGSLIVKPFKTRAKKKLAETIRDYDSRRPMEVLSRGGKHFTINIERISFASLQGVGNFSTHYGKLRIETDGKGKFAFILPGAKDMNLAVKVLQEILGEKLTLNVKWDEKSGIYVKP